MLIDYLKAGGKVDDLKDEMLEKYKELFNKTYEPLTDEENRELETYIAKEIECLKT